MNKIMDTEAVVAKYKEEIGEGARLFPYTRLYSNYKTMEVITSQLMRSLLFVIVCVFLATLLLIANLITSVIVVFGVFMVLIDVGGIMYFWNIPVDTSAAILLTLAIGLAIDYSAHVAHAFMVEEGTRNDRVQKALRHIGPAVLNGGFSTFLAFVMLATSTSHVFKIFFKIFFLIVVLGLYHGLVFLPVVLSLIGPASVKQASVAPSGNNSRGSPAWQDGKKVSHKKLEAVVNHM